MMKRSLALLAALLLSLMCMAPAFAAGLPAVVDNAGLFNDAEEAQIETLIEDIRSRYQMDGVVFTTQLTRMSDSSLIDYADRLYEDYGYGLGDDRSGFLIMIDMGNRYVHISTAGSLRMYLDEDRRDSILDKAGDQLADGEWGKGAITMVNAMARYLKRGVEEGSFMFDEVTGRRLSGLYNKLTAMEALVSIAIGAAVALAVTFGVISRYSLRNSTYRFNKMTQSSMHMDVNQEQFVRETVRRVPKNTGNNGGVGGSGGGHSGKGVGVHISSGGMSHGGGGRHF